MKFTPIGKGKANDLERDLEKPRMGTIISFRKPKGHSQELGQEIAK